MLKPDMYESQTFKIWQGNFNWYKLKYLSSYSRDATKSSAWLNGLIQFLGSSRWKYWGFENNEESDRQPMNVGLLNLSGWRKQSWDENFKRYCRPQKLQENLNF